jgi:hypothetical protein
VLFSPTSARQGAAVVWLMQVVTSLGGAVSLLARWCSRGWAGATLRCGRADRDDRGCPAAGPVASFGDVVANTAEMLLVPCCSSRSALCFDTVESEGMHHSREGGQGVSARRRVARRRSHMTRCPQRRQPRHPPRCRLAGREILLHHLDEAFHDGRHLRPGTRGPGQSQPAEPLGVRRDPHLLRRDGRIKVALGLEVGRGRSRRSLATLRPRSPTSRRVTRSSSALTPARSRKSHPHTMTTQLSVVTRPRWSMSLRSCREYRSR